MNNCSENLTDEKMLEFQCYHLSSALLLKDYDVVLETESEPISPNSNINWINKGELIAGSYVAATLARIRYLNELDTKDIDIYFKNFEDVKLFINKNNIDLTTDALEPDQICARATHKGTELNLIWGVEYKSPEHLVSKFDIRACSVAYDPSTHKILYVKGAVGDLASKKIVFNPVPRATSIQRLVKYIQKGFEIDKYQRLFFAELIRSDIYSKDLELTTGY